MGAKLKEIRLAKKMSQEELSRAANVSRATISAIENDKDHYYSTKTLKKIASALGTTVDSIFFG